MAFVLHDHIFPFLEKSCHFLFLHLHAYYKSCRRHFPGFMHKMSTNFTNPCHVQNLLSPFVWKIKRRHRYFWQSLCDSSKIQKWLSVTILVPYLNHILSTHPHTERIYTIKVKILHVFMLHTPILGSYGQKRISGFRNSGDGTLWKSMEEGESSLIWSLELIFLPFPAQLYSP